MSRYEISGIPTRLSRTPLVSVQSSNALACSNKLSASGVNIKGTIVEDEGTLGADKVVKDEETNKILAVKENLLKKLKTLERRMEGNARINREKTSSLEDRLTEIQVHVFNQSARPQEARGIGSSTLVQESIGLIDGARSPPVPALKRRMVEAWEKSIMSEDITLTGIDETMDGDDKVHNQTTVALEQIQQQCSTQQQQIQILVEQNTVQANQIAFLIQSIKESNQALASLQFDLDVETGRVTDMEGRLEELEEIKDIRDTSITLAPCPLSPLAGIQGTEILRKRKLYGRNSPNKRSPGIHSSGQPDAF
ncbi:hypothetical protein L204_102003 [Cryptococcus depauperatus]